jgi:hypothetical protein
MRQQHHVSGALNMRNLFATTFFVAVTLAGSVASAQTVTLNLSSPQHGQGLSPGATVNWTITADVSIGDNSGLALVSTDLEQDAANPEKIDLPPGSAGSIDATMAQFSRPLGLSNPGEGMATTGYIGVQRGVTGEKNLRQIGGGQNTFGVAGQSIGLDANVAGGVGQSGAQTILSGSFSAPTASGSYLFRLANASANVLTSVSTPSSFSPVASATVDAVTNGSFSFSIVPAPSAPGDMNCDELVNGNDVAPFVLAVVDAASYSVTYPSCNLLNGDFFDDEMVTVQDINGFVNELLGN